MSSAKSSLSFILGQRVSADADAGPKVFDSNSASSPMSASTSVRSSISSSTYNRKINRCRLQILQQPVSCKVTQKPQNTPMSEHRPIHPPPVLKLVFNPLEDVNTPPQSDEDVLEDDEDYQVIVSGGDADNSKNYESRKVLEKLSNRVPLPKQAYHSTYFVTVDIIDDNNQTKNLKQKDHNNNSFLLDKDILGGSKVSSGMYIKLPVFQESKLTPMTRQEKVYDHSVCFVFADVSVKQLGYFKLSFKLYEFKSYKINFLDEITSDEFQVFSQKKFPGAIPSTPLTKFLYKHGARIRQRKPRENTNVNENPKSLSKIEKPYRRSKIAKKRSFSLSNNQKHLITPFNHNNNIQLLSNISPPISPVYVKHRYSTSNNLIAQTPTLTGSNFSSNNSENVSCYKVPQSAPSSAMLFNSPSVRGSIIELEDFNHKYSLPPLRSNGSCFSSEEESHNRCVERVKFPRKVVLKSFQFNLDQRQKITLPSLEGLNLLPPY